jgi:uncharacterized protein (DUF58 family)
VSDGTRLILEDLIRLRAAARGLELGARRQALSVQAGGYLSAYRGRGLEFDEVRAYQAFDDARTIDWRVTARRGRPHTKLFREERERPVLLLADLHRGMYFGSRRRFKSVLAGQLAALLGWAALRAGNRVGGLVHGVEGHKEIQPAPRERGLLPLLRALVRLQPVQPGAWVPGRLDQALARLARLAHPGSLVFLLSDFRELGVDVGKHLGALARHNDVIAGFLYDPLETAAPPAGRYRLGSGSSRLVLDTGQTAVAQRWASQFQDHREAVRDLCRRHRVHFMTVATSDRPLQALQYGLARHGRGEI